MKSEKARDLINKQRDGLAQTRSDWIKRGIVIKAVEMAEEDARKRIIKVYCDLCNKDVCIQAYYGSGCEDIQRFKKVYDNEV